MTAKPQREHEWLERMVGEWSVDSEAEMGPGEPPAKVRGSETVRSLGGLWVLCEGSGDMPGCGRVTTLMTLGFDPARGRFVGTFVASMMTHLWLYEGALDAAGRVLTLDTEGPGCTPDHSKLARYQDRIEIVDNDHRQLSSRMQGEDGSWSKIMTARFVRKR